MTTSHQNKESSTRRFSPNYGDRCVQFNRCVALPIVLTVAATFSNPPANSRLIEFKLADTINLGSHFPHMETGFINRFDSAKIEVKMLPSTATTNVIPTPLWLVKRMEILRQMPPPTSQEVQIQLTASAEIRKKLTGKQPV